MKGNALRGLEIEPLTVGAKLTLEALLRRDMGQSDLARAIGIAQSKMNRYLRGVSKISLEAAFKVQDWSNGEISARTWLIPLKGPVCTDGKSRSKRSRRS